jgi:hypothetical protein
VVVLGVRKKRSVSTSYAQVPRDVEMPDTLLQSQIAASLSAPARADRLQGLLAWASGGSGAQPDIEDVRQQLRTLQTYVVGLDSRYLRREEAAWLSLQVFGIAVGILAGVATLVWAVLELTGSG